MSVIAKRVIITGRVQGVWYRKWTVDQATTLGLTGWVRNRRDGSVEAVFSGPVEKVVDMIRLCREGPPVARVTDVTEENTQVPDSKGFIQLPTE